MSCILHLSGIDFDVDEYLSKAHWGAFEIKIVRKGENVSPTGRFGVQKRNGFSIKASNAAFEDFEQQQEEVIAFIKKYKHNLELLSAYSFDSWHGFDFGLSTVPPNNFSRTYLLSNELLRLVGNLGLEIYMSNYFTKDENYLKRKAKKRWPIKK